MSERRNLIIGNIKALRGAIGLIAADKAEGLDVEAVAIACVDVLGHYFVDQNRIADALERIASTLEERNA